MAKLLNEGYSGALLIPIYLAKLNDQEFTDDYEISLLDTGAVITTLRKQTFNLYYDNWKSLGWVELRGFDSKSKFYELFNCPWIRIDNKIIENIPIIYNDDLPYSILAVNALTEFTLQIVLDNQPEFVLKRHNNTPLQIIYNIHTKEQMEVRH